jgi:hypothetical protein
MGAIDNGKFYTFPGGSFKISDFLKFERYAFKLKTLSPNQHFSEK